MSNEQLFNEKHYHLICSSLNQIYNQIDWETFDSHPDAMANIKRVILRVMEVFKEDNAKFDMQEHFDKLHHVSVNLSELT